MIVTLTANPSIDRAILLESPLAVGEVQRALSSREDAGGKGVNVSRVVAAAGEPTLAVVPLGEHDPYRELLSATGVPSRIVSAAGSARANLTLTDADGDTTKINLPGPVVDDPAVETLIAAVVAACAGARWLVLAGSLPPGVRDEFYAEVIGAVRAAWGDDAPLIAVDASGAALRAVVAGARPDLIKPNEEELAELLGEDTASDTDTAEAAARRARVLVPVQAGAALVTLGADGALLVSAEEVLKAAAPRIAVASTVGAGDSSLAGFLLADVAGRTPAESLAHAIAYGAAAASLPGTQAPTPADLPRDGVVVAPFSVPA